MTQASPCREEEFLHSRAVLLVDDSAVMRRIIAIHIRAMGCRTILEAADGFKALSLLRSARVDLIISDWCMHGMHGIDLLRAVRADESLRHIPFIMVTAEGQLHSIAEARAARVDQYVLKPFTPGTLQRSIREVLGG